MADARQMKEIYSSLMASIAAGSTERLAATLTDDYTHYGAGGESRNKAGTIEMVQGYVTAFPGMEFTLHDMMADGDKLSAMWTVKGVHAGPLGDVPATGRSIEIRGHVLCRFEGDKIAEEWELFDESLMMQQLGLTES